MARYSIKQLQELLGIKAHTIRIWEKRYALVTPSRTDTNIRYYSDEDLRKLINVSLLLQHGFKISRIAAMPDAEITQHLLKIGSGNADHSTHVNQLIAAMVDLDEQQFETVLSEFFMRHNFEQTMTQIVFPFLEKTGVLWQTSMVSPAQEHFISNLIRQKLIVGIDALPLVRGNRAALLFLPQHEMHELGLLFAHYLLRKNGYRTLYLGQAVPDADLARVLLEYKPDILVTCLTTNIPDTSVSDYLTALSARFKGKQIFVGGRQVADPSLRFPKRITTFSTPSELIQCVQYQPVTN